MKKKKDTTQFDCAVRELQEETGITLDMINIIPDLILSETKDNGITSIQYYVGIINKSFDLKNFIFEYDHEEISSVKWYKFDSIQHLDKFKNSRKKVFDELMKKIS